mgnify:CR=1 FL=1
MPMLHPLTSLIHALLTIRCGVVHVRVFPVAPNLGAPTVGIGATSAMRLDAR